MQRPSGEIGDGAEHMLEEERVADATEVVQTIKHRVKSNHQARNGDQAQIDPNEQAAGLRVPSV